MNARRDTKRANEEIVKARQVQVELMESAAILTAVASRLSELVHELNDEVDKETVE